MSIATEIQRLQTAKADIKTAIEEKGVEVGIGTIDTYAEKISEISVGGNGDFYDTFWDTFQDNGNRRIYFECFKLGWTDENYNPKYPIVTSDSGNTNAYDIFIYNNNITDTKVDIDISQSKSTRSLFMSCTKLVTIRKIITSEKVTSYTSCFTNCTNLENVTFEGVIVANIDFSSSSKLSDASIQNIIDHLADLTGGTAQTLDFHTNVVNKLTSEQLSQIANKNWDVV